MLGRAADALRAWKERDDRLAARLSDLEHRLDQSQELDEQRITTVLGEETARIVAAAREAATEIRTRAEDEAARLIEETGATATAQAEAMTGEATALRDEARLVRDEASAAAEVTRSEAQDHADRLRAEASAEHDRLLAAAKAVLDERSAEAEAVAAGIREAAQIELDTARADGAQIREDAREVAAAEVERARTEGRGMVEEARRLRRQMLQDLAERRRTARRQIEAARAGCDRVVESLITAGERVAQVVDELAAVDDHAQRAADAAAAAVSDDLDSVVAELETGLTLGGLAPLDDPSSEAPILGFDETGQEHFGGGTAPFVDDEPDVEPGAESAFVGRPPVPEEPSPGATVHDLFERIRAEREQADDEDDPGSVAGDEGPTPFEVADGVEQGWGDPGREDVGGLTDEGLAAVVVLEQPAEEDSDVGDVEDDSSVGDEGEWVRPADGDVIETTAVVVDEGVEPDVGDSPAAAAAAAVAATSVLDRRDELLAPVEKSLTRTLKRLVSDEQNEVLDRLRRIRRGRPELTALLPQDAELATFTSALRDDFTAAATAGVGFWDGEVGADAGDPAERLDEQVLEGGLEVRVAEVLGMRRAHLQRALEHADADGIELIELGDHVRAAYREFRTQSVPQLAGDLATAGFALGEQAAAGPGTPWCWEVDHGGLPCSDAEDNALAGALECGAAFPTGDVIPPAHPGCRCILVPPPR